MDDENGKPKVTQTHYGSGHNIFAKQVSIGSRQRRLHDGTWDELKAQLLALPSNLSWHLITDGGDGEAQSFAFDIKEFLLINGFHATGPQRVISGHRAPQGITIFRDQGRIEVGTNDE